MEKNIIFLSFVQDNYHMLIKYEKKYETDTFRARNVFFSKTLKPITELKKVMQKKSYFFF